MGAIYMILGLAVMVPMAFLTEELISYLSASNQLGDRQVQAGVALAAVAELEAIGLFAKAKDKDPNPLLANSVSACITAVSKRGVFELLEDDQLRKNTNPIPESRFVVLPLLSPGLDRPVQGYVLKLEGVENQTPPDQEQAAQINMLPSEAGDPSSDCQSYQAFTYEIASVCSVPDVIALRWRTKSDGWRWRWPGSSVSRYADSLECPEGLFLYKT